MSRKERAPNTKGVVNNLVSCEVVGGGYDVLLSTQRLDKHRGSICIPLIEVADNLKKHSRLSVCKARRLLCAPDIPGVKNEMQIPSVECLSLYSVLSLLKEVGFQGVLTHV